MSLQRGINLRALAEKMGQCSGAEVRGICTEAGMYALRERRQHVTQEDFEFAVAKVRSCFFFSLSKFFGADYNFFTGTEKEPRGEYFSQQVVFIDLFLYSFPVLIIIHISMLYGSSADFRLYTEYLTPSVAL